MKFSWMNLSFPSDASEKSRLFLLITIVMSLALVLTACGGGGGESAAAAAAPPEEPAQAEEPIVQEVEVEEPEEVEEPQIQTITVPDDTPMVLVPAGPFEMGSEDGDHTEGPVHTVTLDEFHIDQYEVTNARYAMCVEAGVCDPPSDSSSQTRESYYGNPEYDDYPVIYVNWTQAKTYCEWRKGRLPTEAEWEKAARGTDEREYPWGNDFDGTRLNFCDGNCPFGLINEDYDDGYVDTAPVGSYPEGVSPYGVHDMAGNVREWVNDGLGERYYGSSPSENPPGPANAAWKIYRGGSWTSTEDTVRTWFRNTEETRYSQIGLGFRCVIGGADINP